MSTFRIALGRCSCDEPQPDARRQAVCRSLIARLEALRAMEILSLVNLPPYTESVETIEGRTVKFQTIREPYPGENTIVVVRAFLPTWSRPTWLSFGGVGHMFAEGFIVGVDGARQTAPNEVMWDFR